MLNDAFASVPYPSNILTDDSTHMEDSEASQTSENASVRGDPVPYNVWFLHIKGLLGPCEVGEQACYLVTDQHSDT